MSYVYTVRPITEWPGPPTVNRKRAPFKANWTRTTTLLARELRHLGARDVVLFGFFAPAQIRNDGQPRADARPTRPGVILEFVSRGHRLRFPCDRFGFWQDNLDAIARTLEMLRAIDRYGVTKGEQFEGFRALPPAGGSSETMTEQDAVNVLSAWSGFGGLKIKGDAVVFTHAARAARGRAHPDTHTGSHDAFVRVQRAIEILEAAGYGL